MATCPRIARRTPSLASRAFAQLAQPSLQLCQVKTCESPKGGFSSWCAFMWFDQACGRIHGQPLHLRGMQISKASKGRALSHAQGLSHVSASLGALKRGSVPTPCCKQSSFDQNEERSKKRGVSLPFCNTKPTQSGPVSAWKQKWRSTQDKYEAYTAAFHIPSGCLAVPDDKRKKHVWIVSCSFYTCLLASFASSNLGSQLFAARQRPNFGARQHSSE